MQSHLFVQINFFYRKISNIDLVGPHKDTIILSAGEVSLSIHSTLNMRDGATKTAGDSRSIILPKRLVILDAYPLPLSSTKFCGADKTYGTALA